MSLPCLSGSCRESCAGDPLQGHPSILTRTNVSLRTSPPPGKRKVGGAIPAFATRLLAAPPGLADHWSQTLDTVEATWHRLPRPNPLGEMVGHRGGIMCLMASLPRIRVVAVTSVARGLRRGDRCSDAPLAGDDHR